MALSSLLCEGTPCQQSLKGDRSTVNIYWKRRQHVNIYWKVSQHVNIRWKRKPVVLLCRFGKNSPCVAPSACRARTICVRAFQGETSIHLHLSFAFTWIKGRKVELELFLLQVQLARCIEDQSTSKPFMNDFVNFPHNILALFSLPGSPTWIHTVKHVDAQGAANNKIHLECVVLSQDSGSKWLKSHWSGAFRLIDCLEHGDLLTNTLQLSRCSGRQDKDKNT